MSDEEDNISLSQPNGTGDKNTGLGTGKCKSALALLQKAASGHSDQSFVEESDESLHESMEFDSDSENLESSNHGAKFHNGRLTAKLNTKAEEPKAIREVIEKFQPGKAKNPGKRTISGTSIGAKAPNKTLRPFGGLSFADMVLPGTGSKQGLKKPEVDESAENSDEEVFCSNYEHKDMYTYQGILKDLVLGSHTMHPTNTAPYLVTQEAYASHLGNCVETTPPGAVIYQKGHNSVYEVYGADYETYCYQLCLLGNMFIGLKLHYASVSNFIFYVLTEDSNGGDGIVGYFSKQIFPPEGFNLACLLVLPSFQRFGYGRFLIELSYIMTVLEGRKGYPEGPLSVAGSASYNKYWKSTIAEVLVTLMKFGRPTTTINELANLTGFKPSTLRQILQELYAVGISLENVMYFRVTSEMQELVEKLGNSLRVDRNCLDWQPSGELVYGKQIEDVKTMKFKSDAKSMIKEVNCDAPAKIILENPDMEMPKLALRRIIS